MAIQTDNQINKYTIDIEALSLIRNHDILPKDSNGAYDFYAIIFRKFVFINESTVLLKFRHDCYHHNSSLKEITLKLNGVIGKIELYNLFSETSYGLKISKEYAVLNIQTHALTKDFKLLDITCKEIEVLECNDIEFPENPFY